MKSAHSAYSKMYLVTPTVYEKLLHCLDKSDVKITSDLNLEPKDVNPSRPAVREIQSLNLEALNQPPLIPREEIVQKPETVLVEPPTFGEEMEEQEQQLEQPGLLPAVEEQPPVPVNLPQYQIVNPLDRKSVV